MEDSLQGAIDPALQDPPPVPTSSSEEAHPDGPEPGAADDVVDVDDPANSRRERKRKPPKEPEQIFRRKEANRLAAERSRIRASEKAAALTITHERLEQENRALKAELIALGVDEFGPPGAPSVGGIGEGAEVGPEAGAGDTSAELSAGNGDVGQAPEDENHSRNILAALMKDAGIHVEEGDEASWMQGVENFIKEAESNGRLGDLAAVAADTHGDEETSGAAGDPPPAATPTAPLDAVDTDHPLLGQGKDTFHILGYSPLAASEATLSALAVALNAEIERIVRDEYAATKTAILQIESQIAALANGEAPADGGAEAVQTVAGESATATLEDIQRSEEETTASIESLRAQLPENRAVMFGAEEEKVAEENKLAAVVEQVLVARARLADNEKHRLENELRAISGYVGSLLAGILSGGEAENQRRAHLLDTPLSSPALAHRKRGRPRKGSTPLVYQQSALYRSPPNGAGSGSGSPAQSLPGTSPRNRRRGRPSQGGSRLRESISASALHVGTAPAQDQDGAQVDSPANAPLAGGGDEGTPPRTLGDDGEGSPVSVLSRFKKGEPGSCSLCGRTETSAWRKVVVNGEALRVCNACGLYHSKFGVLRPSDLWGDGKGIRKRRSTRPSGADEDDAAMEDGTPRKRAKGKGKTGPPDANADGDAAEDDVEHDQDVDVDAQFEGMHDLEGITVDMVAEAVASARASGAGDKGPNGDGTATPGDAEAQMVEADLQEGSEVAGAGAGANEETQAGADVEVEVEEEGAEDNGEIVVDEDLQKSFEQLTRHLEQQSRGGGSLTADVFSV